MNKREEEKDSRQDEDEQQDERKTFDWMGKKSDIEQFKGRRPTWSLDVAEHIANDNDRPGKLMIPSAQLLVVVVGVVHLRCRFRILWLPLLVLSKLAIDQSCRCSSLVHLVSNQRDCDTTHTLPKGNNLRGPQICIESNNLVYFGQSKHTYLHHFSQVI